MYKKSVTGYQYFPRVHMLTENFDSGSVNWFLSRAIFFCFLLTIFDPGVSLPGRLSIQVHSHVQMEWFSTLKWKIKMAIWWRKLMRHSQNKTFDFSSILIFYPSSGQVSRSDLTACETLVHIAIISTFFWFECYLHFLLMLSTILYLIIIEKISIEPRGTIDIQINENDLPLVNNVGKPSVV